MATPYGTLAGALAYHAARGNSAWASSTDELRTPAMVRGSDYIDATYRADFPGCKAGARAQEREWPRFDAFDAAGYCISATEVPLEIEIASYEAALRELVSPGSLSPDVEAGGGQLKREKIGPLEFEYVRDGSLRATFSAIELILGGLLSMRSPYSGVASRA